MSASKITLTTVLLLVLVGSAVSLWKSCSRRSPPFRSADWFYDLNTGQLFPGPRGAIPPIDAPSGPLPDGTPAGVRARLFGCAGCADSQRAIAWLETYTVEQRDLLRPPDTAPAAPDGPKPHMPTVQFSPAIKRIDDSDWVDKDTPEGGALIASAIPQCPGGAAPQECWP